MIESPDSEQSTLRAGLSDAEAGEGDNNVFEPPADRESFMQQRSSMPMRPSASTAASASQRQQQQPPLQRSATDRRAPGAVGPAHSLPDESAGAGAKKGGNGKRRARVVEAPPLPADDDRDLLEPEPELEPEAPAYEAEPSPSLARSSKRAPAVNASETRAKQKQKPAPVTPAQARRQPLPERESTALDGERAKRPSAAAAQRPALQNGNGSESAQVVNVPRGREQSRERRTPNTNTASAQRRVERSRLPYDEAELEPELDGAASPQMERDSLDVEEPKETRQTRRPQSGVRVERAPSRERASPATAGQRSGSALPSRPRAGPALASTFDDGSAFLDDAAAPAVGSREAIGRMRPARQPLEQADSEGSPAVYTRSMAPLSGSLRGRTPSPSLAAATAGAREQVPATRLMTRLSPLPRLERERTYYISEEELVVPGPPPPAASVGPSAYERNSNCPMCGSPISFAGLDRQEHERLHQQREAELLAQRRLVPSAAGAAPAGTRYTTRRPVLVEREYLLDEPSAVGGVPARYMRPLDPAEFADPELQRQAQLLEQHADARAALPDDYFLTEQPLMCEFIPYNVSLTNLDQFTRCYF